MKEGRMTPMWSGMVAPSTINGVNLPCLKVDFKLGVISMPLAHLAMPACCALYRKFGSRPPSHNAKTSTPLLPPVTVIFG
jgi:hypothetical protein